MNKYKILTMLFLLVSSGVESKELTETENTQLNEVDVNTQDKYGETALHLAAANGHLNIVNTLLDNGSDINAQNKHGETALHLAAANGHLNIVNTLLDNGSDINAQNKHGDTALHLATANEHLDVVNTLLNNEAKVDAQNLYGQTALYWAEENENPDILQVLLDYKLIKAAKQGDIETLTELIAKGADVNAKDNKVGMTALMWATLKTQPKVVNILLDKEADVHAQDNYGNTALHVVATTGHLYILITLLGNGSDINAQNNHGETALLLAASTGHLYTVNTLLDNGSDIYIDVPNNNGQTALSWAEENRYSDILQVLLDYKLIKAAKQGDVETLTELINKGANVNAVKRMR